MAALEDLWGRTWHTNISAHDVRLGPNGSYVFRGFFGSYRWQVGCRGTVVAHGTRSFPGHAGSSQSVTIRVPPCSSGSRT